MPALLRDINDKQSATSGSPARKALCIGIQYDHASQYSGDDHPDRLRASHGDPDIIAKLLEDLYDFKPEDITVLKDDGNHISPTKHNILKAIDDLLKDAKAGDHFVFHYSGHGGQVPNDDGDDYEEDGMDETIWPVDVIYDRKLEMEVGNYIKDDELNVHLVEALPAETHLTVILDSCHSGTGIDLPYTRPEEDDIDLREMWSPVTNKRGPFTAAIIREEEITESRLATLTQIPGRLEFDIRQELVSFENKIEVKSRQNKMTRLVKGTSDKYVTSWAACVDSAIELEGPNGGLLTRSLDAVLRANCSRTHEELIQELGKELVKITWPAKQIWTERGLGKLSCPRPVLASLQKLKDVYPLPFTF